MRRKEILIWIVFLVALVFLVAGTFRYMEIKMTEIIESKQRAILYELNHKALAEVTREFVWPKDGITAKKRLERSLFEKADPTIPNALWLANPNRIKIQEDRVDFEYGGALLHFGISIFPKGQVGEGDLSLGDGVWFYSENGRYPKKLYKSQLY